MIVRLQIPDDVFETYEKMATATHEASGRTVQATDLMVAQLDRFRGIPATDRVVVIDSRTRAALEAILHGGSLRDSADLLAKVQRLGAIKIGEVRLDFSPGQLEELKHIANRNRRQVKDVVLETVRRIENQFFDRVGIS